MIINELILSDSPYSLRHKPSVTFRMDLNECQYNGQQPEYARASAQPGAVQGPQVQILRSIPIL